MIIKAKCSQSAQQSTDLNMLPKAIKSSQHMLSVLGCYHAVSRQGGNRGRVRGPHSMHAWIVKQGTPVMELLQSVCDLVKRVGVPPTLWISYIHVGSPLSQHSGGLPMHAFPVSAYAVPKRLIHLSHRLDADLRISIVCAFLGFDIRQGSRCQVH